MNVHCYETVRREKIPCKRTMVLLPVLSQSIAPIFDNVYMCMDAFFCRESSNFCYMYSTPPHSAEAKIAEMLYPSTASASKLCAVMSWSSLVGVPTLLGGVEEVQMSSGL